MCKVLIERGAKVDYQNKVHEPGLLNKIVPLRSTVILLVFSYAFHKTNSAMYLASQYGHKDVVELLLDSGASVNKPNMVFYDYDHFNLPKPSCRDRVFTTLGPHITNCTLYYMYDHICTCICGIASVHVHDKTVRT